ncbi:PilX N-terminal domain-containing pilus assembly protein [Methylomonas sp. SURF-1]|uniref:PilX N-terminal domain-containing pilus assembly protein n=1 Tax=Methylomonas aurea TaxID=2952224 RepID=A0ABT1UI25_9GAMM|nr:PilX N-terminal domain-containing pilus assembly protein [Methylomonas sp. SURF-1]MCQ8181339.1 PilX N-terminal domain-containing pilus assembly protein [Methylomonas sp. SURF-1]
MSPLTRQTGATLFTALIFLIMLSVLGVNVAQMSTLEERMAGNSRNQDLALQAAEAALKYVESNLTTGANIRSLIPLPANNTSGTVTGPGLKAINVCLPNNASYWNGTGAADCNGATQQFTWSDANARTAPVALNQIAAQPMYVVERMTNEGTTEKYRVTARAIGGDSSVIVILQAMFSVTP